MNKTKNRALISILKTLTDIIWYGCIFVGITTLLAVLISTAFPEAFQDKIYLPLELEIKEMNLISLSPNMDFNLNNNIITSVSFTYLAKDLFIVRILLMYYLVIIISTCIILFFWRKILASYKASTVFSKENGVMINFTGWLLILYAPLFWIIKELFKTFIAFKISDPAFKVNLFPEPIAGIFLIILGSLMLFLAESVNKKYY